MPIVGGAAIRDLDIAMMPVRTTMRAGRGFLREPAAARFHERHVADITGVIPGIVMHLSVGAVRAAGNGKNMVFNHARSSNVKRRVREMPPLARLLQIPSVVVVG